MIHVSNLSRRGCVESVEGLSRMALSVKWLAELMRRASCGCLYNKWVGLFGLSARICCH
jgi:hypothetical protein